MTLVPPVKPCGNFPTRECQGCADFCERFPWLLPLAVEDSDLDETGYE